MSQEITSPPSSDFTYGLGQRTIGIQVGNGTKNKTTQVDSTSDFANSKHITNIFERLKRELEDLHSHMEKQPVKF
ncbi:hypothetical protein ABEB36_005450 [Hypothenemus hampei]|uniref:Uncharacterized protein n=1 Tax=Hypothenemus hampei TaxID=57062 RepID=A0ABD1EYE1_HYPHA